MTIQGVIEALKLLPKLVDALKELHEENMLLEWRSMDEHERQEPTCEYCALIKAGKGE